MATLQELADLNAYAESLKKSLDGIGPVFDKILPQLREYVKAGGDGLKVLKDHVENFSDKLKNQEGIKEFGESLEETVKGGLASLGGLDASFKSLLNVVKEVGMAFKIVSDDIKEGIGGAKNQTTEMIGSLALFTATLGGLNTNEAFQKLQLNTENTNAKFKGLIDTVTKLTGVSLVGDLGTGINNFLDAAEATKQFENAIISAAGASGAFGEILGLEDESRVLSTNLDWATDRIQQAAAKSAIAMSMSYQNSIKQTMDVLKTLPDEFEKSGNEVMKTYEIFESGAMQSVDAMRLLETTARGTGQTFETVLGVSERLFATFAMNAKDAAERVAVISSVSSDLKIPFATLKDSIQSVDDGFKMWGHNASGTLSVLEQISDVLKEQGVGYAAQLEIATTLASTIKGLGFEKKAFIGMDAGLGGSAIGAGLQVEKMIQEGDWAKVAGMMQETIGKIGGTGGKVLSMEEAMQTPGQETAFMAQRMALGNIFGISDTGMQNRLMEVMSKVSIGTELQVDGTKALEEAFTAGESIQEKQKNILEQIYTQMVALTEIAAGRQAYATAQRVFGPGAEGITDESATTNVQKRASEYQDKTFLTASDRASYAMGVFNPQGEIAQEGKQALQNIQSEYKTQHERANQVYEGVQTRVDDTKRKEAETQRFEQQKRDQQLANQPPDFFTANQSTTELNAAIANRIREDQESVLALPEAVLATEQNTQTLFANFVNNNPEPIDLNVTGTAEVKVIVVDQEGKPIGEESVAVPLLRAARAMARPSNRDIGNLPR